MRVWLLSILQDEASDHVEASQSPPRGMARSIGLERIPESASQGPPEHWVNLVKDRAPELLRPVTRQQSAIPRSPFLVSGREPATKPPVQARPNPPSTTPSQVPSVAGQPERRRTTTPAPSPIRRREENRVEFEARRELPRISAIAEPEKKSSDAGPAPEGQEASRDTRAASTAIVHDEPRVARQDQIHESRASEASGPRPAITREEHPRAEVREFASARNDSSSPVGIEPTYSEPESAVESEVFWPKLEEEQSSEEPAPPEYETGAGIVASAPAPSFPGVREAERRAIATSTRAEESLPRATSADTHFAHTKAEDPWPKLPEDSEPSETPWDVQHAEMQHLNRLELEQRGRGRWSE